MSVHAGTMSDFHASPRRQGFTGRLFLSVGFIAAIAAMMALFQRYQTNLPSTWMTAFSVLMLGLAAGAGSRALFYGRSGLLRLLVMIFNLSLGLALLGPLTNWTMGLGPWEPWFRGEVDEVQLIQMGGALLVALLAMEAWRKRSPSPPEYVPLDPPAVHRSWEHAPAIPLRSLGGNLQGPARRLPRPAPPPERGGPRLKLVGRAQGGVRAPARADKLVVSAKKSRTRGGRSRRRKPNLQISLYEEHRCPYCLEVVKPNDPRGVRKCEICNTLHHADCWEITGFCQVPHLNE